MKAAPLRSLLRLALPLALAGLPARARAGGVAALTLLDAYLGTAARNQPAYRTDLRAGDIPAGLLPAGRSLGWSPWLGAFTYRARRFEELSAAEQAAVLRDPGWRAYLAAAARREGVRAEAAFRISIDPPEMLARRPLRIVLAPAP